MKWEWENHYKGSKNQIWTLNLLIADRRGLQCVDPTGMIVAMCILSFPLSATCSRSNGVLPLSSR